MPDPFYTPDPVPVDGSDEESYLRVAAREVQRIAPAPTSPSQDYVEAAEDAERLAFNYLLTTSGGTISSANLAGEGSYTTADIEAVRGIIRANMGPFVKSAYSAPIKSFRIV